MTLQGIRNERSSLRAPRSRKLLHFAADLTSAMIQKDSPAVICRGEGDRSSFSLWPEERLRRCWFKKQISARISKVFRVPADPVSPPLAVLIDGDTL